jgi:hypothetical protein
MADNNQQNHNLVISADVIYSKISSLEDEMKKIVELMTMVARLEEKNHAQVLEVASIKADIADLLLTFHKHENEDRVSHDDIEEKHTKLRTEFDSDTKKLEAISKKFDILSTDYHAKRNMAIGVGLMLGIVVVGAQMYAASVYSDIIKDRVELKEYKEKHEAEKTEIQEQLRILTTKIRDLSK